jgi:hypothetical protein
LLAPAEQTPAASRFEAETGRAGWRRSDCRLCPRHRVAAYVAIGGDGNPLGELTLYGPFEELDEADKWANEHLAMRGDWWTAEVCAARSTTT